MWHCNGYTAAPIFDYINNPVFQEFLLENDYFRNKSDAKFTLICATVWDISTKWKNHLELTQN